MNGRASAVAAWLAVVGLGCSAPPQREVGASFDSSASGIGTDGQSSVGESTDFDSEGGSSGVGPDSGAGDEGGGTCSDAGSGATVRGVVYAPNGTTPISGALVFAAQTPPEPIPDHVYCEACVEIDCDNPFVFTEPDGSFEFDVSPGSWNLVIQKGQFRRVTAVEIEPGSLDAPPAWTTMPPARNEAAGEFAPNIALVFGAWDRMENLVAKLGLAEHVGGAYDPGAPRNFDFYTRDPAFSEGWGYQFDGSFHDLLGDPQRLARYHIVFLACEGGDLAPNEIENLRDYVAQGGRFYATDLEAAGFEDAFAQYQDYGGDGGGFGPWPGHVEDPDLAAWLASFGHGVDIELHENPSEIADVHQVLVDDLMGGEVDVGHHVWVSAARGRWEADGSHSPLPELAPSAVSGQFGCGRILYTTYHNTADAHVDLLPQELTMLYLILEVGACQTPAGVPPVEG